MRHLKDNKKFSMTGAHRKAMFRNMVTSLLQYEKITTTLPRAKELRRFADRMITLGKKGDLSARRKALGFINSEDVVTKLFSTFSDRYKNRNGGYTRVFRAGVRAGDNAPMAVIELVDRDESALAKRRVKHLVKEDSPQAG